MSLLSLEKVSADYDGLGALQNVSLRVDSREILAMIGLNGAGTGTLLAAISGLAMASSSSMPTRRRPGSPELSNGSIPAPRRLSPRSSETLLRAHRSSRL